jgi:hypothetical protein
MENKVIFGNEVDILYILNLINSLVVIIQSINLLLTSTTYPTPSCYP